MSEADIIFSLMQSREWRFVYFLLKIKDLPNEVLVEVSYRVKGAPNLLIESMITDCIAQRVGN